MPCHRVTGGGGHRFPFEAADWIGFALLFGVVLGAIRTAAVAAALRRGRRPGPRDLIDLLSVDDAS